MTTNPNANTGAGNNDPGNEELKTTIPGAFDPALLQKMIDEGIFIETAAGLMAAEGSLMSRSTAPRSRWTRLDRSGPTEPPPSPAVWQPSG